MQNGVDMSFISFKNKKNKLADKKLPPHSAWGHYTKKQGTRIGRSANADVDSAEAPLVTVSDVSLSYEGRNVIEGLSFDVCRGDYLCVIGENGSGKSTLMSAILGLKKVSGGKISMNGLSRGEIGVLPQQSQVQKDFPALVEEVVITGCLGRSTKGPFMTKDARKIAFASMEKLGITSIAKRPYRELSGGQQQRVMIARALCAAEKMLVLDEPVTGLDPKSTADIYSLISHLNRAEKMTIVMVTHDVASALRYSTHILRINKDSVFFGSTEEYKTLPEASAYLDREKDDSDADIPYGEGGFRYKGGIT